jgi:outer membrane protein OmpA-like peptidoglycan-associated protein
MKRTFFLISASLFASFNFAQTANLQLFYEINEYVSSKNNQRVDSFLNQLKYKSINVNLVGYADFLSNQAYNQILSLNRAKAIKNYLSQRKTPPFVNVLNVIAEGEKFSKDNQTKIGEAAQRRVDLVILSSSSDTEVNTRPIQLKETVSEKNTPSMLQAKVLEEVSVGQKFELEGLSFIPGQHILLESSIPILEKLLETLKENPNLKIEIHGHVCCVEDFKPDALDYGTGERKLSVNRAKAVFDYLIKNGISNKRLKYKGFGHKNPKVYPETTPEEEQMNRRVEVMVVEK